MTKKETKKNTDQENKELSKEDNQKSQKQLEEAKKALRQQEIFHLNLGYILGLFSNSKYHSKLSVTRFMNSVIPVLRHNQFKLFFKGFRPIGFVSWSLLSDEVAEKYKEGKYLFKNEDWKSGENIWIIDFVVPYSKEDRDEVIKNLKEKVFVDKTINALLRNPYGSIKKVVKNFEE